MVKGYTNLSRAAAIREYRAILLLVGTGPYNQSTAKMLDYAIKLKDYFNL